MTPFYRDIIVTVDLEYGGFEEKQSYYAHKYTINITNNESSSFQLMRRKWHISDGLGWVKIVEGDGVVGIQPVISPGETYSYQSWSPMPSTLGYMRGVFYCRDMENGEIFEVEVPIMTLIAYELSN